MSFSKYIKEQKLKKNNDVITFDFDHTLKFEHGLPNTEIVLKFKNLQDNNKVYIVTTRHDTIEKRKEIERFVEKYSLKPIDIIFTNGKDKVNFLIDLGSVWHFDDDEEELKQIEKAGIKVTDSFSKEDWQKYIDKL